MTGTGTQADPYIVETMEEFCSKVTEAGVYIELAHDLDCIDWEPPNVQYTMACNQIDGKGYHIKNMHLDSDTYLIAILFRLAPTNQNAVMKNLHWKNNYLKGVTLFLSGYQYGYNWTIQDCTFSCELFNGRFLQTNYVHPKFLRCSVYLYCTGISCDPMTPDASVEPPIWDTCNIEINGTIRGFLFQGRLVNSQLKGEVEVLNPDSNGGVYSVIWISNQGNEAYPNSLINMTVKCSTTWSIYSASAYAYAGLLVNTTRLQNYQFQGATQIFIPCNDSQMNDTSWLRTQGFDVGEESIGFSWHDFLMNGSDNRIHTLECGGGSPTFPFTINGSSNTFSSTVTLTSEKHYCYTVPYNSWQWNTYNVNIQSCRKYKLKLTGNYDTGLTPYAMAWRNGESWWGSMGQFEIILTTPDSSSTASFGIGAINYTGNSVTGTFTVTNFEVTKFSYWDVVNGKLVNSSLPEVPILGAFCNAYGLGKVFIPTSVKKIGPYAFRNTQLTSVTIASDCTYYPTSFPDGCIIETVTP